jgi:molybdenum cofactor synthesis domain-containing protein
MVKINHRGVDKDQGIVKTAALIVIGDEILTGKVKDENTIFFANTMFENGIKVARVLTIPDDVPIISESVLSYSKIYDYVFTSGGVGPTHDDKTFSGVANAFSLPLVINQEAYEYFRDSQIKASRGPEISLAQQKMLKYPSPCKVYFVETSWLPVVVVNNVYILPGVPRLFHKLLHGIEYLFKGEKFFRRVLYTDLLESLIAEALESIQEAYPKTFIGSYPQEAEKPFNVIVTIEGIDEPEVCLVTEKIMPLIQGRKTAI